MRTFLGNGSVWDAENDKNLCTFVDGKFSTDSKRIADKLTKRGNKEITKGAKPKPKPKPKAKIKTAVKKAIKK